MFSSPAQAFPPRDTLERPVESVMSRAHRRAPLAPRRPFARIGAGGWDAVKPYLPLLAGVGVLGLIVYASHASDSGTGQSRSRKKTSKRRTTRRASTRKRR